MVIVGIQRWAPKPVWALNRVLSVPQPNHYADLAIPVPLLN